MTTLVKLEEVRLLRTFEKIRDGQAKLALKFPHLQPKVVTLNAKIAQYKQRVYAGVAL